MNGCVEVTGGFVYMVSDLSHSPTKRKKDFFFSSRGVVEMRNDDKVACG